MTLSQEDGQLYYKLWLPLLDYVNKKYRINSKMKSIATAKSLNPADVKEVANKLWSEVTIIDDYLKENEGLPEEHKEIVHAFTSRECGVSNGYYSSLNMGIHTGDDLENIKMNYKILCKTLGLNPDNIVLTDA